VHEHLKDAVLDDMAELIDSGAFIDGAQVAEFERAYADYCGTKDCVGVASGTDALRLALLGAGIEAGDEVIVPASTFVATLEAVTQARGAPVIVDVLDSDYNIDAGAAEAAITARTRVVVPVHLYGQMADMARVQRLTERHGLQIVEDACQAHGAQRDGRRAGSVGLAAAFSFYPSKNLGAMGDAGALVTNDAELASRARAFREHGQRAKGGHEFEGYTARLDTVQAAVLLRKLPHLGRWNEERRAAARFYTESLAGVGDLRLPVVPDGSEPVWHLYAVRTAEPGRLAAWLAEHGVGTGRHYPQPPHLSTAYSWLGHAPGRFPVAEALARETLSLPMFPGISADQLDVVTRAIVRYFDHGRRVSRA
jgi:dTDP-4-amino-4,6-dideoxygalactose transaminase